MVETLFIALISWKCSGGFAYLGHHICSLFFSSFLVGALTRARCTQNDEDPRPKAYMICP
jgi:hypothetical protein